jgi:hypothetical protein
MTRSADLLLGANKNPLGTWSPELDSMQAGN